MEQSETPGQAEGPRTTTTKSTNSVTPETDADLLRRADRALRAALKEGLGSDADVQRLQDYVAQRRVQQRRTKAKTAVQEALTEIRRRGVMI